MNTQPRRRTATHPRARLAHRGLRSWNVELLEDRTLLDGAGHGLFPGEVFETGEQPMSVVSGDFNSDGVIDLATASSFGRSVICSARPRRRHF